MNTITTQRPETNTADLKKIEGCDLPKQVCGKFANALSEWKRLRLAVNAADYTTSNGEQDGFDLLVKAEARLLDSPVQNVHELRALAEVIFQDPDSIPGADTLAKLFSAILSLDKGNDSPTFDAAGELAQFEKAGLGWVERDGAITFMDNNGDRLDLFKWLLETRGATEQVKQAIADRTDDRETQSAWAANLSAYQTAKARLDEHQFRTGERPAFGTQESKDDEDKLTDLSNAHYAATVMLLTTPAPTVAAYRQKVELHANEQAYLWNDNQQIAEALATDAKSLLA